MNTPTAEKKYRISWIEHHECEVTSTSETAAFDAASDYTSGHDTCSDCDNYEIRELNNDQSTTP